MRSPSIKTTRSSSVDSFVEKFRSWNTSLSNIKLRASLLNDKAPLQTVKEHQNHQRYRHMAKSTSNLSVLPSDSAVHLPDLPDVPELRERYNSGDKIFQEHVQNVRQHRDSQSSTRQRICLSRTPSAYSHHNADADFNARIEEVQKASSSTNSGPVQTDASMSDALGLKLLKAKSATQLNSLYRRKQEQDGEALTPSGRTTFMDSIKATQRLKGMKSLKMMRTNPHESLDFRCVGEEFLDGNPFEQFEFEQGKEELLRSLNISRLRLDQRKIRILKGSKRLDAEAQAAAQDLDRMSATSEGSSVIMDEATQRAQLIGPPGYGGFATGERWATYQYKRHMHTRSIKHATCEDCPCQNYKMFAAITDEQWRYAGIGRTKVDRRWVVLLSEVKQSQPANLTLASPTAKKHMPETRTKITTPYGIAITTATCTSDEEDEGPPALPAIVF